MKKPRDHVDFRRFPFLSLSEAERYRASIHPHFSHHTIRENGDGKVGFWKPQTGGYHLFLDSEIRNLQQWRHNRDVQYRNAVSFMCEAM